MRCGHLRQGTAGKADPPSQRLRITDYLYACGFLPVPGAARRRRPLSGTVLGPACALAASRNLPCPAQRRDLVRRPSQPRWACSEAALPARPLPALDWRFPEPPVPLALEGEDRAAIRIEGAHQRAAHFAQRHGEDARPRSPPRRRARCEAGSHQWNSDVRMGSGNSADHDGGRQGCGGYQGRRGGLRSVHEASGQGAPVHRVGDPVRHQQERLDCPRLAGIRI